MSILMKLAGSIAMKLLTSDALQDLFIWSAEKLAANTKSSVDDELVDIIKKHLEKADEAKKEEEE